MSETLSKTTATRAVIGAKVRFAVVFAAIHGGLEKAAEATKLHWLRAG